MPVPTPFHATNALSKTSLIFIAKLRWASLDAKHPLIRFFIAKSFDGVSPLGSGSGTATRDALLVNAGGADDPADLWCAEFRVGPNADGGWRTPDNRDRVSLTFSFLVSIYPN